MTEEELEAEYLAEKLAGRLKKYVKFVRRDTTKLVEQMNKISGNETFTLEMNDPVFDHEETLEEYRARKEKEQK